MDDSADCPDLEADFYLVAKKELEELLVFCPKCGTAVPEKTTTIKITMVCYKFFCESDCDAVWESQPTIGDRQSLAKIIFQPFLCTFLMGDFFLG